MAAAYFFSFFHWIFLSAILYVSLANDIMMENIYNFYRFFFAPDIPFKDKKISSSFFFIALCIVLLAGNHSQQPELMAVKRTQIHRILWTFNVQAAIAAIAKEEKKRQLKWIRMEASIYFHLLVGRWTLCAHNWNIMNKVECEWQDHFHIPNGLLYLPFSFNSVCVELAKFLQFFPDVFISENVVI